ncbi:MAG: cob(I)yrinic acid a,c-diamide adenosyltransferase [Candidatus Woesearchaeota archaeon]
MERQGLIHVYTGEAKGKSTAAMGLALRAAGRGFSVLIVQLFKDNTGEKFSFQKIPNVKYIQFSRASTFFKDYTAPEEELLKQEFFVFWNLINSILDSEKIGLLVLDEISYAFPMQLLSVRQFLDFIESRRAALEIVLTGRNFPDQVISAADYVTSMTLVKHPFVSTKLNARIGIEY